MIFTDKITLKKGGAEFRRVRGIATFLDSSKLLDTAGGNNLVNSRLRFYLSPAGEPLPSTGLTLSWDRFPNLVVEGAIEPHYRRGRLHHYECVAKPV